MKRDIKNKKPCKECPFRKTSLRGWLGTLSNDPHAFLSAGEYEIMPCHMKVNYDEAEQRNRIVKGENNPCIGALSFFENACKLPRGSRQPGTPYNSLIKQAQPNEDVFRWEGEFIKHHTLTSKL